METATVLAGACCQRKLNRHCSSITLFRIGAIRNSLSFAASHPRCGDHLWIFALDLSPVVRSKVFRLGVVSHILLFAGLFVSGWL